MERLRTLTEQKLLVRDAEECVRWLCLKASLGTSSDAAVLPFFEQQYPRSAFVERTKAAVPPVTTANGGGALLPPSPDALIALIQEQTLPTRMGLSPVPFNVPLPRQTTLGTYSWVLQGAPTPVTAFLSVASKTGGFVALFQLIFIGFIGQSNVWGPLFWVLAALTHLRE